MRIPNRALPKDFPANCARINTSLRKVLALAVKNRNLPDVPQ
jgi:hypothetical protein